MATFSPFNFSGGFGHMRGVTLALPSDRVQNFLPSGLELGEQSLTPKGTHPVVLYFHDMFRAGFSIPIAASQSYHEYSMNVPFVYLSPSSLTPGRPGPYQFMTKLYLDNLGATLVGLMCFGFAKEMASIQVTTDRYTITSLAGQRLMSLAWKEDEQAGFQPVAECANFQPIREMVSQPLISVVPFSVGPFFAVADFDKNWDVATVRPLQTVVEVDVSSLPGYDCGRYPSSGWSPGIDQSVLGSYELRAPWRLSLPYPPMMSFGRVPG
jgi:hypothetical protein